MEHLVDAQPRFDRPVTTVAIRKNCSKDYYYTLFGYVLQVSNPRGVHQTCSRSQQLSSLLLFKYPFSFSPHWQGLILASGKQYKSVRQSNISIIIQFSAAFFSICAHYWQTHNCALVDLSVILADFFLAFAQRVHRNKRLGGGVWSHPRTPRCSYAPGPSFPFHNVAYFFVSWAIEWN